MLTFNGNLKVYVALEPCDMRKSFITLAALVRNQLSLDPLSGKQGPKRRAWAFATRQS